MISGKYYLFLSIVVAVISCNNHEESNSSINHGPHQGLVFIHRPAELIRAFGNDYTNDTVATCADVRIGVTSSLKIMPTYSKPDHYTIDGDKEVEEQIRKFFYPNGVQVGMTGYTIEYRTEVCKSIHITLHDRENTLIKDITDMARFYYVWGPYEEDFINRLIINSDRKLIGILELGSTVSEYLAYKPMIFANAHFIFPELPKSAFENGNYAKVEIELENGTTLVASTADNKGVP